MDLDSPVNITGTNTGSVQLSALAGGGRMRVRDNDSEVVAELTAALGVAVLSLGGNGLEGTLRITDANGTLILQASGRDHDVRLFNADGDQTVTLDGAVGDVRLTGGDAAEDFEFDDDDELSAGMVMVIAADGKLTSSRSAYDRRVAGVISGAGAQRPGIRLGAGPPGTSRRPIALAGTVSCLADATRQPIRLGGLLTTSDRRGHAMAATDRNRAFGAVIGKALAPLARGTGLIPVLVALQ
jgi:hypothetical protein